MKYFDFDDNRKLDIVPIGRIAIDFNPMDINMPLSESKTFKKYLGGSPANIAVGLARLGKKIGFMGKVSKDQFGKFVVDYFNNEGIDTSQIKYDENGGSLGLTFTEILSPTESRILMYRNGIADLELKPDEIDEDYIKNTKAIIISGTALAKSPSREAVLKALELAKKNKTMIVFDIDYRSYTWNNKDEIALYYSIVGRRSDIIIGSREEFDLMEDIIAKNSSDEETAKRWIGYGNKIIVIKHGKEGSKAYTENGEVYKVQPFKVKLLKSFGGGDAYASAFIYGILENWDISEALEFGSASAAMLVASHSCSEDMPTVEEIRGFIESYNRDNYERIVTVENAK
ncbi:5-dehydro-2-deoxygluconokinase [Clostridium sp. AL.422]|uniref:5-dehydro-2-deoxygluconokinase n=1 Tax=Clostridium TaxID=1485 RepID=UPI00293DD4DD|nr:MULTISPECIES: 5-dehydro-2-deoxygluconokinase [unclassified Clostridium]MDV4152039.1 5-dehydro-2-deoxygluconokinase [Clostridium sp. AL.422]